MPSLKLCGKCMSTMQAAIRLTRHGQAMHAVRACSIRFTAGFLMLNRAPIVTGKNAVSVSVSEHDAAQGLLKADNIGREVRISRASHHRSAY